MVKEPIGNSEEVITVLETPKKKTVFSNKKGGDKILRRMRKWLKAY